jgi:four helix bundle protein
MSEGVRSYQDLLVWQKAMSLAELAYRLVKSMPKAEEYRLVSQLLRAAASIPANIAEGHSRGTRKAYAHHVSIARGSAAEVETLLILAKRADLLAEEEASDALNRANEIGRMLNVLHQRLSATDPDLGP